MPEALYRFGLCEKQTENVINHLMHLNKIVTVSA